MSLPPRGLLLALDDGRRRALQCRLQGLIDSGPLPQYPPRLSPQEFERYRKSHQQDIDGALHFIRRKLQPRLGATLRDECPDVHDKAVRVGSGELPFIRIVGFPTEEALPPTPFRGSSAMSQVAVPRIAFILDLLLLGLLDAASSESGFLQSNIDPADELGGSAPLYFHMDRGAHVTALGALRGKRGTRTHVVSWTALLEHLHDPHALDVLCQARFRVRGRHDDTLFNVLAGPSAGAYMLAEPIVDKRLELADVIGRKGDRQAQSALAALHRALSRMNAELDTCHGTADDADPGTGCGRFELREGDALLLNNRRVLHGRSSAVAQADGTNRWLRAAFGERRHPSTQRQTSDQGTEILADRIRFWSARLGSHPVRRNIAPSRTP